MVKKLLLTVIFSVASISWSGYSFAGNCAGNGSTQSNTNGVAAGQYTQQFELDEFEKAAGCTMQFSENPNIASINASIQGNKALPALADRLPEEPLVVRPYDTIGKYGGTINFLSNATEAGTSDMLSTRHVNLVRFADDLATYISKIPEIGKVVSVSDYLKAINQAMNEGTKSFYSLPSSREVISQYMLLYDSEFNSLINSDLTKLRVAAQIKDIDSRRSAEIEKEINTYIDTVIPNGMTAEVTGTAFLALRTNNYLVKNLLASFLVALIIITFLMVILFRSIKMAFISILPNIIPMMVMAAVLGFLQIPLRPATAMTFAVAFGIAVDDTLHYLIRYRMELSNRHYREANDSTMLGTGIAMMSTTAILSAGFLVLTLSTFTPTVEFGMLSVITIITALIGDLTFLPALLSQIKPKIKN